MELLNPEFQVNTYTASSQSLPSVVALPGGGWVVVWMSNGQDGDGTGIYGQRYAANGGTLGAEFRINTTTAADQGFPAIDALNDGGWVVTWMSADGDGFGIYGQRYSAAGNTVGTEFIINTATDGDQVNPHVIGLADGGWLVAWDSDNLTQDGSRQGIYAQRFNGNGNTVGQEFQINTYTDLDQWYPSLAALDDGGWITTWISNGQDGSDFGIYGRRYDSAGAATGAEFRINTYTSANQWFQSVAPLNDDGWVVTWGSEGQDGSSFGIYGQRYTAGGSKSGSEFLVNSTTNAEQNFPSVTGLSDGGWIVTWGSNNQDGSGFGIFGQRYAADGSQVGTEFQINTQSSFDQRFPSVAALANGNLVVVWESEFQDGSEFGIHGQQLSLDGGGTSFSLTASAANPNSVPLSPTLTMMEYDNGEELFLRPVQLSADQVAYELVARPALQSGTLEFQLSSASPLIDPTPTDALASWTVQINSPNSTTLTVTASGAGDGSDHLAAGTEVVLATFSQLGEAGASLTAASVGGRAVADQSLDDTILQQLGTGDYSGTIAGGSTGLVGGQLDYDRSSRAIVAQDALDALRLAVGLQTTQGTADAYDYIAADFNRDGRVTAQDALEILRYAVGLSTALDTEWTFVDSNGDLSGVSRQDVSYQSGAIWTGAAADTEISLIGILVGDVNDSFTPV